MLPSIPWCIATSLFTTNIIHHGTIHHLVNINMQGFGHCDQNTTVSKTPLWPKGHPTFMPLRIFATVTKTPLWPKRHCGQNATQNFRHASNNHCRIFLISFSECIHWMHSTNNIKNIYFYIFGIISLPCFINSLPSANITNNHLDTTLIYLVTTLQWYKSLS